MASEVEIAWIRAFFYGPLGSGKTEIASHFPDPVFVLPPNEGSIATLQGRAIPYRVVGDGQMGVEQELRATLEELVAADRAGTLHEQYGRTFVFENLSHLADSLINQWTNGGKTVPDQRTWGQLRTTMMYMRDSLVRLKAHVIFTALDKITTDESGKITSAGPRISGAAAELLPSSCDLVGVCEQLATNPPKWQVHFRSYGAWKGRTRLRGMPPATLTSGTGEANSPTIFEQISQYLPQHQTK